MKNKEQTFTHKKKGIGSKLVTFFLSKIIVGKMEFIYHGEKPEEPSVFVGNHTKFYAPLAVQYKYPEAVRTWSAALLLERKTCYELFKNKIIKNIKGEWFFRLILPIMAPIISWYYRKQLNCIPVHRDRNITKTFEISTQTLQNGVHIALYPEIREEKLNDVVNKFATGFVYMGHEYYNITKKKLKFYPVYCAPSLHQTHFGIPIEYNPDKGVKEQSKMVGEYLESAITEMAKSLPAHKIVHMLKDFNE